MDDRFAWAEHKTSQRLSSTGLGGAGGGSQFLDPVEAEIISDDEYGRCLSYAYKMDPSGDFAMMIILGFRAGLRMTEVAGLETSDFASSDKRHELHLQSNRYRNLKTPDSRRIVPLDVLMTPRELAFLNGWLAPRRKHARKIGRPILCFGPLGGQILPSAKYLTDRIDKILKAITGQDLTYHCLRHSFSSYLMLKLLLPDPESELLIPGSFRNIVTWSHSRQLHNRLIGRGSLGQSAMHAVSMLMGHTGIPRTLKSYQHLLDLAVYLYCSRSVSQVPLCEYIRDHLDEDLDEPRLAPPKLIDPNFLKKSLREMKPLLKSSDDLLPLNKNTQFREKQGEWRKSGLAPWTTEQSEPAPEDSTDWQLVHKLITLPPFVASALALKSRVSNDRLSRWRKSRRFLVGKTQIKTRPQTLYLPRGAIADDLVEKLWRRKAKVSTEQDLSLLREFLDGYRTNDGACRFSSEERAKEFAALLRSLGVPGEHIGIAFGSRTEVRACQHHTDKMALYPEEAPYHYREAKLKPVEHPRADKRPALWVSYIKLEEDELGWSFSRQHRLDALNDLRDEEALRSGELLSKRRLAAKAKREARANEIKKLNEGGRAVYQPGTSAYLFGLQMLAIFRGITKDNPS
ncbi:hypothetical protein D3M59_10650 [Sphingomonas edaphi]|uniref:DOD-type homing endonuclease domain-containing protein n=2 Tax=Sphingomonas edaphi TaxID=2315689 RepID=A0A418PY74_9SPHN|nr:hypothetical protein D3M59_10650 [Sphingomonas edaphi]